MNVLMRRAAAKLTAPWKMKMTSNTFSRPLISQAYYSTFPATRSEKITAADQLLFDDSVDILSPTFEDQPLLRPGVVVYDGVCHLCHTGVKWIIKADRDRKIKFCCLQSQAAEPYIRVAGLEREDVLKRFLFVETFGLYHQGSAAGLKVLSYLPMPYSALSALRVIPTPLADAVYDFVAKRRYDWFGKADDCLVLKETELLERFIDWEELLHRSRSKQI